MNKTRKKSFVALLITCLMVLSTITTAFATDVNSSVTFADQNTVYFKPGSTYTTTDLFDSFKGVMPGDKLTEKILVKNEYNGFDAVTIYLRAVPHDEAANPLSSEVAKHEASVAEMNEFLNQMKMTVTTADGKVIFDGSPAEAGGLKEDVKLGTFRKGQETMLTVDLLVPIEMDNEFQERVGEVDWVFRVDETPDPPRDDDDDDDPPPKKKTSGDPPDNTIIITDADVPLAAGPLPPFGVLPATGDTTDILPYACLMIVGICGTLIVLISSRKKKNK